MSLPELAIHVDVPDGLTPRAQWTLDTMLAPLGRCAALTRDPSQSAGAAFVYAAAPASRPASPQ